MLSNRYESLPLLSIGYAGSRFARVLLSIRYTGSRFARCLENIASRVYTGWVENVVDSTRFDRIVTNRFPCCRIVMQEVDLGKSIQGGLKMLSIRFDSNESTRVVSLAVDSLYRKSICEMLKKYSFPGLYRVG